jgi:hypothetical protein
MTPHTSYDLEWLCSNADLLFDARNAYASSRPTTVERL